MAEGTTGPERKPKTPNLSSVIGWVVFVLAIAGGPILRGLQNLLGGTVQLANLLPYLVGGLVLLSFVVSALRAAGSRGERSRMPGTTGGSSSPAIPLPQPMPPFGGEPGLPQLPPVYREPAFAPPARLDPNAGLRPPRFEPIVSPALLVFGLVGTLVLAGAALLLFALL